MDRRLVRFRLVEVPDVCRDNPAEDHNEKDRTDPRVRHMPSLASGIEVPGPISAEFGMAIVTFCQLSICYLRVIVLNSSSLSWSASDDDLETDRRHDYPRSISFIL